MLTISMFYEILVLMFFRDNRRHHLPHIHVRYQGEEATIAIEDGRILDGKLPPKQLKMVQAWIEIHSEDRSCYVMLLALTPGRIFKLTLNTKMVSVAVLICARCLK